MASSNALHQGRESFQRWDWGDAYILLSSADHTAPLEPEDLERLAITAYLTGRDADSAAIWERTHNAYREQGNVERAARCAFWLAFGLLNKGQLAHGGGWLARARRLLDDGQRDCVEQGYLLLPVALESLSKGDTATAQVVFREAAQIGDRFEDPDLMMLGRLGQGQALVQRGQTVQGVALLDEAMIAVTVGEVSPLVAGTAYCAVIEACQDIFDLRRAQEWTAALDHWCEAQPDLVLYRGQCLVRRSEIMQFHGSWQDAMDEAQQACERLSGDPAIGMAFYQRAELHRLRGEFAQAEEAYRWANQWGRSTEPGLALLRLAQGRVGAAESAIRRAMDEAQQCIGRSRLLSAYVEIMLAAGNMQTADAAASELSEIASDLDMPLLRAMAIHARGSVLLHRSDARSALGILRRAWIAWQEIEAPYEAARVRTLIGLACRQIGDEDAAEMELDAASRVFQDLGAAPDLARVKGQSRKQAATTIGGLTPREVQVLRLVAAGKTNRAIAGELFLSEKTVARHLSNIFTKLGLSSRAAATAYAYEHELL